MTTASSIRPSTLDDRRRRNRALAAARHRAFHPEPYAGQESFVRRREILDLATAAGIDATSRVVDLCCGVGGPGDLVTRATGCRWTGVDRSPAALALARETATPAACLVAAEVPALPFRRAFDVVLLLETFLAFREPAGLLAAVADALVPGGRFAFTFEAGAPLDDDERRAMPEADTVWLHGENAVRSWLAEAGFAVRFEADHTASHAVLARSLLDAFTVDRAEIARHLGDDATRSLLAAHALWAEWLARGRVRKLAVVGELERW